MKTTYILHYKKDDKLGMLLEERTFETLDKLKEFTKNELTKKDSITSIIKQTRERLDTDSILS